MLGIPLFVLYADLSRIVLSSSLRTPPVTTLQLLRIPTLWGQNKSWLRNADLGPMLSVAAMLPLHVAVRLPAVVVVEGVCKAEVVARAVDSRKTQVEATSNNAAARVAT